jgi:apolipoprotein D and lipocalin family protein
MAALAVSLAGLAARDGLAQTPMPPVARFEGLWFEIVGYGSWWQRRCVRDTTLEITAAAAEAALRSRCRTVTGWEVRNGRLKADGDDGRWRARFAPRIFSWLPAVWGDFWILAHDDRLTWMVVGERSHQRLSILARTPALDEAALARGMAAARRAGFDVDRLARTPHDPDEWRTAAAPLRSR